MEAEKEVVGEVATVNAVGVAGWGLVQRDEELRPGSGAKAGAARREIAAAGEARREIP